MILKPSVESIVRKSPRGMANDANSMTEDDLALIAVFPAPYKSAFGTMRREPTPQENIAHKRLAAEGYLERAPEPRVPA